ncbi:MAG: CPBP family intramembrane glutamic endopeptidase, partial [Promethearchaeota archaeon]
GFRGLILFNLKEKYSEKTSILISGTLFSLFHFANMTRQPLDLVLFGVIMGFILGTSWGYLVSKSDNIITSILAHYLVDALGFYFVLTESASIISILIMYIIVSFSSVAIIFLLAKFFFKN